MPVLGNPKHEKFAQAIAGNVPGVDAGKASAAYEAAGFRGDRANAIRLARRPDVQGRVAELLAEQEERLAAKLDGGDLNSLELANHAARAALATGNLQAQIAAAKLLSEHDGALQPRGDQAAAMPDSQIVAGLGDFALAAVRAMGFRPDARLRKALEVHLWRQLGNPGQRDVIVKKTKLPDGSFSSTAAATGAREEAA